MMRRHAPLLLALALTSFVLVVVGGVIGAAGQRSLAVVNAAAETPSLGPEDGFNSGLSLAGEREAYRWRSEEEADPPWGRADKPTRWSAVRDAGLEASVPANDRDRTRDRAERWERTFIGNDEHDGYEGEGAHDDDH